MTIYFETSNVINASGTAVSLTDASDNDTLVIAAGVTVAGGTGGGASDGAFSTGYGISAQIDGMLWGNFFGLDFGGSGGGSNVEIGTAGSVIGNTDAAIELLGTDNVITNNGEILSSSGNFTIFLDDNSDSFNTVNNNGLISGADGMTFSGAENVVDNTGIIEFQREGIFFDTTSGLADTVKNSGTIEAAAGTVGTSAAAIYDFGTGTLSVTDSGQIDGSIVASAGGNTIFIGATGSVTGTPAEEIFSTIGLGGTGNVIINDGEISGPSAAANDFGIDLLNTSTGSNSVTNNGTIADGGGIELADGGNTVGNSGVIDGAETYAIFLTTSASTVDTIDNSGTIETLSVNLSAIADSGAGTLDLFNSTSGHILGRVAFDGGASVANQGVIEGGLALDTASATTDTIDNSGTIAVLTSNVAAIYDQGAGTLNVTNEGHLSGALGIVVDAASGIDLLDNSGSIEGSEAGVYEAGSGVLDVTNSGKIGGGISFATTAASGTDTLDNTGLIAGPNFGVYEGSGGSMSIDNSGTISGVNGINFDGASDSLDNSGTIHATRGAGDTAVGEGGGSLSITNSGHIAGAVSFLFSSGASVYDGTLGSVSGWVTGGSGSNTFTGGAGTDHFDGGAGISVLDGMGGNDVLMAEGTQTTIAGGDGNDTINMASFFNASDQIDGGDGKDTLTLDGNYSTGVVLGADTLTNVEKIVLTAGFSYSLTTNDNNVAAGATLAVDGSALTAGQVLTFNGSAETDGRFVLTGGTSNDVLTGGAGNDMLTGNAGNNLFTGGMGADHIVSAGGHDHFIYNDASESTGLAHDVITGFNALEGKFDLDVTVTGINSEVISGRLSAANFDANLATAIGSAQLAAGHAVLFTPTVGNLAGHTLLIVDANGVAGYQAGQDYVFDLAGATHLTSLAVGEFI